MLRFLQHKIGWACDELLPPDRADDSEAAGEERGADRNRSGSVAEAGRARGDNSNRASEDDVRRPVLVVHHARDADVAADRIHRGADLPAVVLAQNFRRRKRRGRVT